MRFPYLALRTRGPIASLLGGRVRDRPVLPIQIAGPLGSRILDANLDSGSDDTLFPHYLAQRLGIDLSQAPEGEAGAIGGVPITYRYALVTLHLSDGFEECVWEAIVGFIASPMRWAILGHAGALQFFDVNLLGDRHEAVLEPNSTFSGRYIQHRSSLP